MSEHFPTERKPSPENRQAVERIIGMFMQATSEQICYTPALIMFHVTEKGMPEFWKHATHTGPSMTTYTL